MGSPILDAMDDTTDWTHEQVRQFVDAEQVFAAHRAARTELAQRFAGSMAWKTVSGHQYLYRKRSGAWASLGPRTPETETAHAAFHDGRARLKRRLSDLARRLDAMAPVNRALGLGRMPVVAARALRALAAAHLLGTGIRVVAPQSLARRPRRPRPTEARARRGSGPTRRGAGGGAPASPVLRRSDPRRDAAGVARSGRGDPATAGREG